MPSKLTARKVEAARPGKYSDGGNPIDNELNGSRRFRRHQARWRRRAAL